MRNISGKMYISCSITFSIENGTIYNIVRKNTVKLNRPQMTIWRTSPACWITNATSTHSEYVILMIFPLQKWLLERASVLCYMYTAYLVNLEVSGISVVKFSFLPLFTPHPLAPNYLPNRRRRVGPPVWARRQTERPFPERESNLRIRTVVQRLHWFT
jgi:hypothetical protein